MTGRENQEPKISQMNADFSGMNFLLKEICANLRESADKRSARRE